MASRSEGVRQQVEYDDWKRRFREAERVALAPTTGSEGDEAVVEDLVTRYESIDEGLTELRNSISAATGRDRLPEDAHASVRDLVGAVEDAETALATADTPLRQITARVIASRAAIEQALDTAARRAADARRALDAVKAAQGRLRESLEESGDMLAGDSARVAGWDAEARATELSRRLDEVHRAIDAARLSEAESAAGPLDRDIGTLHEEVNTELQRVATAANDLGPRRAEAALVAMEDEVQSMDDAHHAVVEALGADVVVGAVKALEAYEAAIDQVEKDAREREQFRDKAVNARDRARVLLDQKLDESGDEDIARKVKGTLKRLSSELVSLEEALAGGDAYAMDPPAEEVARLVDLARTHMASNAALLEEIEAAEREKERVAAEEKAEAERLQRERQEAELVAWQEALEATRVWGETAFAGGNGLVRQVWAESIVSGGSGGRPGEVSGKKSRSSDEAAGAFWGTVRPPGDTGLLRGLRYYPPKDEGIRSAQRHGQIASTYCSYWGLPGAARNTQFIVHVTIR